MRKKALCLFLVFLFPALLFADDISSGNCTLSFILADVEADVAHGSFRTIPPLLEIFEEEFSRFKERNADFSGEELRRLNYHFANLENNLALAADKPLLFSNTQDFQSALLHIAFGKKHSQEKIVLYVLRQLAVIDSLVLEKDYVLCTFRVNKLLDILALFSSAQLGVSEKKMVDQIKDTLQAVSFESLIDTADMERFNRKIDQLVFFLQEYASEKQDQRGRFLSVEFLLEKLNALGASVQRKDREYTLRILKRITDFAQNGAESGEIGGEERDFLKKVFVLASGSQDAFVKNRRDFFNPLQEYVIQEGVRLSGEKAGESFFLAQNLYFIKRSLRWTDWQSAGYFLSVIQKILAAYVQKEGYQQSWEYIGKEIQGAFEQEKKNAMKIFQDVDSLARKITDENTP